MSEASEKHPVFRGGGATGALMRATDWATTPLGPTSGWPQSLRTAVSIVLDAKFPMYIAWGADYVQLYNDGYRPILGSTKHPAAMGRRASETFAESWHIIGPMFDGVRRGDAIGSEDWMLPLDRHGYLEECYFTFSYSPIRDETGEVGGVLVTVSETTARVIAARRLLTLQTLSASATKLDGARAACAGSAKALARGSADLPFALLYLTSADGERALLAGACGVESERLAALSELERADPFVAGAIDGRLGDVVSGVRARVGDVRAGDWPNPTAFALAVPISKPGDERPYGVLVAGINPGRQLDEEYRQFFTLVAGHVSTAVTSARALEEAHERSEALAELDRAKTTFFSNVSHEFRTPLTLLLAPLEDMVEAAGSDQERARVRLLQRNALRLLKLVNTLLEFSRIEAGRIEAVYAPTDLSALTTDLASSFRAAVEGAGLALNVDCPPLSEPVYVDREMWEKIVLNLLSNAFKFTFEGSITVRIRTGDRAAILSITDTGIGIAASELPRLFERFHRIEGARSRSHEGSGIGLALVDDLVGLHHGELRVESVEGKGTTFTVRIPLGTEHLPSDRIRAARGLASTSVAATAYVEEASRWSSESPDSGRPARTAHPSEPTARIVVADDNADMRSYVARVLGERWTVEATSDGEAALEAVRREAPDLVVSDMMMPRLDGLGLVRALRSEADTRSIPVVLLSARADLAAKEEALHAGADDYILKPFEARDLLVRVSARLAAAKGAQEAREQRANLYRHFLRAPFPIAIFRGPEHVVELANEATLEAWGKRSEDVVGRPLLVGLPELAGQPFPDQLDGVYRTGLRYDGRGELYRLPNGPEGALEDRYANYVYAPLFDANGAVEGVLLSAFDVTEQVLSARRVEQARADAEDLSVRLRASADALEITARRLEAAQRVGGIGMYDWDLATNRVHWSPELYALLGVAPSAIAPSAEAWTEALYEEDREIGWSVYRDAVEKRAEGFELELRLRQPGGGTRWVRLSASLHYDEGGAPVRVVGALVDIEALKRATEAQDRARVAAERTANLAELFVAVLGHDLRNPLSAVITGAHLLGALAQDERQKRTVQRVLSSGLRISRMIDQILDFSRIRAGKGLPYQPAPMVLRDVVGRVVDELASKSQRVELTTVGSTEGTWDADRLGQVFSNLVGNAIEHSGPGAAVDVRVDGGALAHVEIFIHNEAVIAEDVVDEIFEPFRQGRQTERSSGLGLGLYVSKEIVLAHGGTIGVTSSAAAGGTTFRIVLPRVPVSAAANAT